MVGSVGKIQNTEPVRSDGLAYFFAGVSAKRGDGFFKR